MAWKRNSNSSVYADTDSSLGGGGSVSGTSSPGGSFGKPVNYVNDSPFSNTSTGATAGKYHPRHLYGRRGHTQGAQTQGGSGGGFNRLGGGGSWTGSSPNSGGTPNIKGIFTGVVPSLGM